MTMIKYEKNSVEMDSLKIARLKSKRSSSSRNSSFVSSAGTNGTDPIDYNLLIKVKKAVNEAVDDYIKYHANQTPSLNRGHINGFFSIFRHGAKGKKNAEELKGRVLVWELLSEAINELDCKLGQSSMHYHIHSLGSYLVDKMLVVAKELSPTLADGPDPITKKYALTGYNKPLIWGRVKEILEQAVVEQYSSINYS